MKIALTGSQGFIGTNLCNRLLISHEVENFDFTSTAINPYLLLEKLRQKENYDLQTKRDIYCMYLYYKCVINSFIQMYPTDTSHGIFCK